ncbi:hypothetical protein [Amycolatopsis lurida]|uniref:hypothetical protein n=1 Tax=Amycolatopsis lurida TaxID=31959 RepID=UPI0036683339
MTAHAVLLAQAQFDPTAYLNFGVLGLLVVSLLTGWLWTRPSVDRLTEEKQRAIAEKDRAEAQRDAMAQVLQDRLLPVVSDFITTTKALMPLLQEIQQLQQMVPLLHEIARTGDHREPLPAPQARSAARAPRRHTT